MSHSPSPTDAPPADSPTVIRLCRGPLWRGGVNIVAVMALVVFCLSALEALAQRLQGKALEAETQVTLTLTGILLTTLASVALRRLWARRFAMPNIVFHARTVALPLGPESRRCHEVRYEDILSVGQADRPYISVPWPNSAQKGAGRRRRAPLPWHHFFVESSAHVYSLPEPMFADANGHERFFMELQRRLAGLPLRKQTFLRIEKLRRPALVALQRRPWATQAILGMSAVLFLNTVLKGSLNAPFGLLRWGAMAPALAAEPSQAYRLLAATFLHGFWAHALINGYALHYMGGLLERLLGWQRMVLLYLCAGAAAMAGSAYAAKALMSVGASGALFGLFGAFAILHVRLGLALPLGVRQPWHWWALLAALNAIVPQIYPFVDWVAHACGTVAGAVLMAALLGRHRGLPPPAGRTLTASAGAVVALQVLALGYAVMGAATTSAAQEQQVAALLLNDPRTPAATLFNFAWMWGDDPAASTEDLQVARACAQEALRRSPRTPDYLATLAEIERRLGDGAAASQDARLALEELLAQMPWQPGAQPQTHVAYPYATRLGLTLAGYLPQPAPVLQPEAPASQPVALAPPPGKQKATVEQDRYRLATLAEQLPTVQRRGTRWLLHGDGPLPAQPRRVWLLLRDDTAPVGVVELALPAKTQAPWPFPADLKDFLGFAGSHSAQVAAVLPAPLPAPTGAAPDACRDGCWRGWRMSLPAGANEGP